MNRPPAFQFYPKDFLMDDKVIVMNLEEKGAYILLLSYCWNNNGLTNNQKDLKNMCGNPNNWEAIWVRVGKCFYEKKGKLYNKRLEKELKKQKMWREKSRLGGIQSGISRGKMVEPKLKGGSIMVATKPQPKGNSSPSSSSSSSIKLKEKNKNKPSSYPRIKILESDIKLSEFLLDKILENNPESRVRKMTDKQMEKWQNDCRLMREQDERTSEQIKEMISWTQADSFWCGNILSMGKLRKQWDMIAVRMKKSDSQGKKKFIFNRE